MYFRSLCYLLRDIVGLLLFTSCIYGYSYAQESKFVPEDNLKQFDDTYGYLKSVGAVRENDWGFLGANSGSTSGNTGHLVAKGMATHDARDFPWLTSDLKSQISYFERVEPDFGAALGSWVSQPMIPFRVVQPDGAADVILKQIGSLPADPRVKIVASLDTEDASVQRTACTAAVKDLSNVRSDTAGGSLINDFSRVCIGSSLPPWVKGNVSVLQKSLTDSCIAAYKEYRTQCLGMGGIATTEQLPFVGVVVRRVAPGMPQNIICTATLVRPSLAVTAAHCIEDLSLPGNHVELSFVLRRGGAKERKVIAVAQAPGFTLKALTGGNGQVATRDFAKQDDIAFLFFKPALGAETVALSSMHFPYFSPAKLYDRTALVGFQVLAKREFVLKWLEDNKAFLDDEALLKTGGWHQFIYSETTPHCMAIRPAKVDAGGREIGHQCQSFSGTSGAPMFIIRDNEATFEIGALHTLAAELKSSDAAQVANEGIIVPQTLSNALIRLEGEAASRFAD